MADLSKDFQMWLFYQLDKLTEDFAYFRPLCLLLQDASEFGADVDVAHVVQQDPDHAPRQMHDAEEAHELTELKRRGRSKGKSVLFPCVWNLRQKECDAHLSKLNGGRKIVVTEIS